ncbi:MAG: hypothetical protein JWL62_1021 [Hyphomicrobiales bacterium]|nr:hypothetical protein [Hyphomicrobiales bacterium]
MRPRRRLGFRTPARASVVLPPSAARRCRQIAPPPWIAGDGWPSLDRSSCPRLHLHHGPARGLADCGRYGARWWPLWSVKRHGRIGITTTRNAIREASRDGLLTIQERRRHGRPNLPNGIRLISREWLAWISRGEGPKKQSPRIEGLGDPRFMWNLP